MTMKPARRARGIWFVLALFASATVAGCGGKATYPVHGEIAYKDGSDVAPLAGGQIVFEPADPDQPKVSARGFIKPDGTFEMSTYREGDGVPPGKYRVMVAPPPFFPGRKRDLEPPVLFNERYRDFATSGLEIAVTGPITDYKIIVQRP
jgi:hypothetical protein